MAFERFNNRISHDEMVIVEFYADWNDKCHSTTLAIEQLMKQMPAPLTILRIDIDLPHNYRITKAFNVYSVPTVLLFSNGRMSWRCRGITTPLQLHKIVVRLLRKAAEQ